MRYSVVIPTLNEEWCVARCLRSIREGTEQPDEILVADGYSRDATRTIARSWGATVLDNPARHAAGGRNVALAAASGDIIVFTDADACPQKEWLARIKAAFTREPELQGLGGLVVPTPFRSHIEEFSAKVLQDQLMTSPDEELQITRRVFRGSFLTVNCAYRKTLLDTLHGFSEWFGNHAEDIDLFWRAIDSGSLLRFLPQIVVEHSGPHTLRAMVRKNFRNGISSSKLSKVYGKWFQVDGHLYRLLLRNVAGFFVARRDASLYCVQLTSHLLGKYIGSLAVRVINL